MAERVDLLGLLDTEWQQLVDCPSTRRRLRCWQVDHPSLRGVMDLRRLLQRIEEAELDESSEMVWAVLDFVGRGDVLAARAVLQLIVPGLAGETRWLVSWARRIAPDMLRDGEVGQLVVIAGVEAVQHAAGSQRAWPISSMLRRVHRTLVRDTRAIESWMRSTTVLDEAWVPAPLDDGEFSPGVALLDVLVRARGTGIVSAAEVRLLWLIDVEGYTTAELAPDLGVSPRAVAQRRLRAEHRLIDLLAS